MSTSKHTPGPWRWNPDNTYRNGHPFPGFRIDSGSRCLMAWLETGDAPRNEVMANAELIAAAPDMLEALHEAENAIWVALGGRPVGNPAYDAVRAAIAKATGK